MCVKKYLLSFFIPKLIPHLPLKKNFMLYHWLSTKCSKKTLQRNIQLQFHLYFNIIIYIHEIHQNKDFGFFIFAFLVSNKIHIVGAKWINKGRTKCLDICCFVFVKRQYSTVVKNMGFMVRWTLIQVWLCQFLCERCYMYLISIRRIVTGPSLESPSDTSY